MLSLLNQNSVVAGKKRNRQRNIISLSDIRTSDLENGDTHLRTKQSIAKLMSDAERQYVAEYTQKAPMETGVQHNLYVSSTPTGASDHIKVQQLNDGPGNSVGEPNIQAPTHGRSGFLFSNMFPRRSNAQVHWLSHCFSLKALIHSIYSQLTEKQAWQTVLWRDLWRSGSLSAFVEETRTLHALGVLDAVFLLRRFDTG